MERLQTAALGDLDSMDLDEARTAAAAAKKLVAQGIDPTVAKKAQRTANIAMAGSQTVGVAVERYLRERSPDWTVQSRRTLSRDLRVITAELGSVPLAREIAPG